MNIRSWFWLCCVSLPVTAALIALPGCSGAKPEAPKAAETAVQPVQPPAAPVVPGLDIGDVEAGVVVSATVPPEAISEQVAVDNMETARKRLSMATVTVKPPYPAKLTLRVTLSPQVSYEKQPVVVRGRLRRSSSSWCSGRVSGAVRSRCQLAAKPGCSGRAATSSSPTQRISALS